MDDVSAAFVARYEHEIDRAVQTGTSVSPAVARSALHRCIERRLLPLVPRVLVVEFHAFRESLGLPVDSSSDVAWKAFLERLGPDEVTHWTDKYPVLGELVDRVVSDSSDHIREICRRWDDDRAELIAAGLLPSGHGEVEHIEHLDSDPHQGGRMVAVLRLAGSRSIVYKPRSLGPEILLRTCLRQISAAVGGDLGRCVPESLDRGTHGWQREVAPAPAASDEDARNYFRAFGAAGAMMGALGATDMHQENVVAAGDHPIFVDLETVLYAELRTTSADLPGSLLARVNHSIAGTLLLPQRLPSGPYSVLMGGIGVPHEQRSERTQFVLVNRDTDAVDIARRTYTYQHEANLLRRADSSVADAVEHTEDFLEGFRAGQRAIARERKALLRILDNRPATIRQIFRGTAVYGNILSALTHPDNLRSWEDFDRVADLLKLPSAIDGPELREFVTTIEREAFRAGEIPRFTVRSDDVRLESGGHRSAPFCATSPRDRAAAGIARTSESGLAFDEHLVADGFSELRNAALDRGEQLAPCTRGPFHGALGPDGPDWTAVVERLQDAAVETEGPGGMERGWVVGAFGPQLPTYEPGTSVSFHDAGGLHVLFDRAARHGSPVDRAYSDSVRRGLETLRGKYPESLEQLPLSVASGSISLDYVLAPSTRRLVGGEEAVLAGDNLNPHDFFTGVAGAGLLLAGYPGTSEAVLRAALAAIDDPGPTLKGRWDLAHGEVGLIWARHRMAVRLGDDESARVLGEAFVRDVSAVEDVGSAGWCNGSAGMLMVAAEVLPADGDAQPLHRLAEKATRLPPPGQAIDLSVCHGASGVVQALVAVARYRDERWPLELAADYWARVSKHARDEGYCTGHASKHALRGYFLGWAGIADTGLLLQEALAGAASWVPLTFTRATTEEVAA
jgi:lantibiotic modifying enzyme